MFPRLVLAFVFSLSLIAPSFAEDGYKPDDTVSFDLSAEDWVTTKTAHVTLNVEAAVSASSAGMMRADMNKAVNDAAKADWKLVAFNRTQDSTGMEHWSVSFDARLPEANLNGLADAAKKSSKPGMQVAVGDIDFAPTLEETEATRAALRAHILKDANDQLASLNAALPGRNYRIMQINFEPMGVIPVRIHRPMLMAAAASAPSPNNDQDNQEHSQKLTLVAHVTYGAVPPVTAGTH